MSTDRDQGARRAGAGEKPGNDGGGDWRQLSKLLEQLPPHAIEAEMSLLGAMLVDPAIVGDVLMVIRKGEDFYKPANGAIFDAMVELYDRQNSLDLVQLNQVLTDRDVLGAVGGVEYLVELAHAVPAASNATHYARLVREKALIRQLITAAGEILKDAYSNPDNADDILGVAEQRIFRIAQRAEQSPIESMQALVQQVMTTIEENEGQMCTGVPTGFHELDEMTHGLQRGEMIIIAARPSMGKTAFALNVAEQMAMLGHPVGVFSLEMGKQQLVMRMLSSRSGVDSQKIRRNMLGRDDWARMRDACAELYEAPIYIDDTPGLTLIQLRAKARRMKSQHGIDAIIIDYLQLMSTGHRNESRQVEISEISRGVKAMARELNVPVICLSQLNRASEQREGHRPRMSDLRESGSIEQDADVVTMLHREEYYHIQTPEWAIQNEDKVGVAELIIAKQRNGPTGTVKLTWVAANTRFRDHTYARPPAGYVEATDSWGGASAAPAAPTSHYQPGSKTGPVADFRDGGGPDDDEVDGIPI